MLKASIDFRELIFKEPGGTSRGILTTKRSYFIHIWRKTNPPIVGVGECSILPKLSPDDRPGLEEELQWTAENIQSIVDNGFQDLQEWPAILFAVETALLDLNNGGNGTYFSSEFTSGKMFIPINGLIWMGSIDQMKDRIEEKLSQGYRCLKLKIGALNFQEELALLKELRKTYTSSNLELRLDANGAFSYNEAAIALDKLAPLDIHSIEQPIQAGQWEEMAQLCANSPIDIALDEELIGIYEEDRRKGMIETIHPQYIILKPSLLGGFTSSERWIHWANEMNVNWWITSALESNVGLNAIAQWTATLNSDLPQGLGTGQVFTNNIEAPLFVENGHLKYRV